MKGTISMNRKNQILTIAAVFTAAALFSSCARVEEELPDDLVTVPPYEYDTYEGTDNVETLQPAPSDILSETASESVQTAQTSQTTTSVTSEEISTEIPPIHDAFGEPPVTSSAVVTAVTIPQPDLPQNVTVPTESEIIMTEAPYGTLPTAPPAPETTTASSQVVTIVTIPTLPQNTEATSRTEQPTQTTQSTQSLQTEDTLPTFSRNYTALNFPEQKAMWVSYLEFERMMRNADEESFTQALAACFDNSKSIGCNTIYFHVRAYGDAYYNSSLFPKGDKLTGSYDPLEIACKLAHERGLSLHAWINPMRLMTDQGMQNISDDYDIGRWYRDSSTKGTYMVISSGRWYLNPAYADTVALICKGVSEIVSNYDVDGVQIDDYFYPTTDQSFDSAAYAASGTALSLADWRRENVTGMVKKMYKTVHACNPSAVFGISPQGNVNNNYNDLYADVGKWVSEDGCCDYICPQIYFGFNNAALPFTETVAKWREMVTNRNIRLVIGLAAYKTGTEDKYAGDGRYEWQTENNLLARQRETAEMYSAGYAYFRYESLFLPEPSVSAYASAELNNLK